MTRDAIADAIDEVLRVSATLEATAEAEASGRSGAAWDQLVDLGFAHAPLPESAGGGDLEFVDGSVLLDLSGRRAAFMPVAETAFLGGWLLASAGLDVPPRAATSGPVRPGDVVRAAREADEWVLSGAVEIPWATEAETIALLAEAEAGPILLAIDPASVTPIAHTNVAGEPRELVDFTGVRVPEGSAVAVTAGLVDAYWRRGALTRVVLAQGAMESALDLTITYARQREQFGRPIGSFQAVAQHLAVMAREVELSRALVDLAISRTTNGTDDDNALEIASARVRTCGASACVARLSHQVHGAIGITSEYALQSYTRRLWAWRDEFGDETYWATEVGRRATSAEDGLWDLVTSRAGVHTVGQM